MTIYVKDEESTSGQTLVRVTMEKREDKRVIEAVFQYDDPTYFTLTKTKPGVLTLLSVTNVDTRQNAELSELEKQQIYQAASEYAVDMIV